VKSLRNEPLPILLLAAKFEAMERIFNTAGSRLAQMDPQKNYWIQHLIRMQVAGQISDGPEDWK